LLAKLSAGDVIAQEFKYHPACLAALIFTRERAAMRQEGESNIKDASLKDIALAELVSYIFETQRNSTESVIFRLADLVSMYQERLSQLGLKSLPVHTTRLKEKLLNKIPGLKAHTKGRDLLLIFEKDIGPTIALACDYSDTIHMAKTAEIIREDLQKHKSKFMGSFSADEIQSSIPSSLLHLVKMIEHGPDIKSQLENDRCKSDLTIAQLLMFNYHPNITKRTVQQRHSLERETPFCVYLGLLIYAKTRKKQLIDILFQYVYVFCTIEFLKFLHSLGKQRLNVFSPKVLYVLRSYVRVYLQQPLSTILITIQVLQHQNLLFMGQVYQSFNILLTKMMVLRAML